MKNIVLTLVIVFGLTAVSFGQKTNKTTVEYVVVSTDSTLPMLNSYAEFEKGVQYSLINKKLIRKQTMTDKDTYVTYYFKLNLKTLVKGRKYKVKRETPKLY